jgi:hypothetical protein
MERDKVKKALLFAVVGISYTPHPLLDSIGKTLPSKKERKTVLPDAVVGNGAVPKTAYKRGLNFVFNFLYKSNVLCPVK